MSKLHVGKLLVYEKKPLNASVLARATSLELNQVRSLKQLSEAVATSNPLCVGLAVELYDLASALRVVYQVKYNTNAAVIAMPEAAVKGRECLLYEAGVDLLFWSMQDRDSVQRLMRAKLAGLIQKDSTFKSRLWARLPWKRHATGGSS